MGTSAEVGEVHAGDCVQVDYAVVQREYLRRPRAEREGVERASLEGLLLQRLPSQGARRPGSAHCPDIESQKSEYDIEACIHNTHVRISRADSCLREGSAGSPRQFKTPRFAEMALYSFLEALTQYSSVSPRARLFSQLLGHDDALYLGEDAAGFALLVMSIILDKSKDPNGAYSSAGMGMIPVRTGLRCTPSPSGHSRRREQKARSRNHRRQPLLAPATVLRSQPHADATSDTNVVGAAVADAQRTSASRRRRRTTTTTPCPR